MGVYFSKAASFSDLLLLLRKPSGGPAQSSCGGTGLSAGFSAAGCVDGRATPAAWPGGLRLPKAAIHLALIGSSPAASRMSLGRLASLLSTFSPRLSQAVCLPACPSVKSLFLSLWVCVPTNVSLSLPFFSSLLCFVYCRASSLAFPLPQE